MIEQFKNQSECSQVILFDRSIIVALQGFADNRVDFLLQCQKVLFGPGIAKLRDYGKNAFAMAGGVVPIVSVKIATQPGGGRTDPGKKKQGKPEVVAVLVQKGPLGPVDDRRPGVDQRLQGLQAVGGQAQGKARGKGSAIAGVHGGWEKMGGLLRSPWERRLMLQHVAHPRSGLPAGDTDVGEVQLRPGRTLVSVDNEAMTA